MPSVTQKIETSGPSRNSSTTTGEPVFRTRGDANPGPDPGWVRAVQVRGTVWYAVPLLGYPASVLTGDQRELIIAGAAGSDAETPGSSASVACTRRAVS